MATSFTTSMTAVSSPSGVTMQTLIDRLQNALSDSGAATWSEALLLEFLNESIRAYSAEFKRQISSTITTAADDRKYDLPTNFHAMISVEYPTGDDPPTLLERRPYTANEFWDNQYYDVIGNHDDQNQDEIWIGEKPDADETITLQYQGDHSFDLVSANYTTVPDRHHHILILYGIWRAKSEFLASAQVSSTRESLDIDTLSADANTALKNWEDAMEKAKGETAVSSIISNWKIDSHDRIY